MKNIKRILYVIAVAMPLLASCAPTENSQAVSDNEIRRSFYQAVWIDCLIYSSDPSISFFDPVLIENCTETLRIAVEDRIFEDRLPPNFPNMPNIPLEPSGPQGY